MKKFILPLLCLFSLPTSAVDMAEEGIVLNQELQFLQESAARSPNVNTAPAKTTVSATRRALPEQNLEQMYFDDNTEEDSVSTRAAARRRRGDF